MKLTNKYNLPHQFKNLLERDSYNKGSAQMSVTQLLNSPRIEALKAINQEELQTDLSDEIWKLLGQTIHTVMEKGADESDIVEQRFFCELEGMKISGQVDCIRKENNKNILADWKFTSVFTLNRPFTRWEEQLNCYAWLVNQETKMKIDQIEVVAILKDWQKGRADKSNEYPQAAVETISLPLWTEQAQKQFLIDRITVHQEAQFNSEMGEDLPFCSPEETWMSKTTYAIQKDNSTRAVKVFDDRDQAHRFLKQINKDKKNYIISERKGEPRRCLGNYCQVNEVCDQWKKSLERM
jgi:hypothetical protein